MRIKTNAMRGGTIENVFARRLRVGQVAKAALTIDFYYEEGERGRFTPTVRNVALDQVTMRRAEYALYLRGFAGSPIRNVSVTNSDFGAVAKPNVTEHVVGLSLANVRINGRLAR